MFKIVEDSGVFRLSGAVSELADFSEIVNARRPVLTLDLGELTQMNSKGVARWIEVLRKVAGVKIGLQRIPVFMVNYANQIVGFLPDKAIVESFYVPYFDENQERRELVLFRRGQHFDNVHVTLPAVARSEASGEKVVIDCHPDSYFKFLGGLKVLAS